MYAVLNEDWCVERAYVLLDRMIIDAWIYGVTLNMNMNKTAMTL